MFSVWIFVWIHCWLENKSGMLQPSCAPGPIDCCAGLGEASQDDWRTTCLIRCDLAWLFQWQQGKDRLGPNCYVGWCCGSLVDLGWLVWSGTIIGLFKGTCAGNPWTSYYVFRCFPSICEGAWFWKLSVNQHNEARTTCALLQRPQRQCNCNLWGVTSKSHITDVLRIAFVFWLVACNIFVFHNIWDNPSHWLIFFRGVETTNQFLFVCWHGFTVLPFWTTNHGGCRHQCFWMLSRINSPLSSLLLHHHHYPDVVINNGTSC